MSLVNLRLTSVPPPPALSLQDVIQSVESETENQPLLRLQAASSQVRELAEIGDAALGYFVDQARNAGHSWSEIGEALGVSKQAAQQKHTVRMSFGLNGPTLLTPRAQAVIEGSEPIARRLGHRYIGTEHLFLALYRQPEGVAAQVLAEAGLPADEAEAAVAGRTERGSAVAEEKLPFTPKTTAVLNGALAAAVEMGHSYIGTEHLLLGLARGEGIAADILVERGLTEETLALKVSAKLAAYREGRGTKQSATTRTAIKPSGSGKAAATKRKTSHKAPAPRRAH